MEKQKKTNNLNNWLVKIPDSGAEDKKSKEKKVIKKQAKRKPKKPKKQTNLDNFFN